MKPIHDHPRYRCRRQRFAELMLVNLIENAGEGAGQAAHGVAGAFDEAVTTGLQRKRTTMKILTDLLRGEITHHLATSVRYQMSAARLTAVKDLDTFGSRARPYG